MAHLLAFAMMIFSASGQPQTTDLPELGDSAGRYLSPAQETEIGQRFFRQLMRSRNFIEDYELQDYLQSLGEQIGASADLRGMKLAFNLILDNRVNAFAVPGGFITFNTGLLTVTEEESELASVVSHEIAHLSQRHLARLIAKHHEDRIPALAAILGSILVGGQAGLAGATLTSATVASNQLTYSRAFEREADSIGVQLLADSGYDPDSMAQFFRTLEAYTRHDQAGAYEFLQTHPLSLNRIAESEAKASEYPPRPHTSSFEYHLAKAKIRALYRERNDHPEIFLEDQIQSEQEEKSDAARYGLAVYLTRSRNFSRARRILDSLASKYPGHPWIGVAQAENELSDDQAGTAVSILEGLLENHPSLPYLHYHLANAYLANHQPEQAKKFVRYQIRRNPQRFRLYAFLSRANADLKNLAEAHQAKAEYHTVLGNYPKAIESLELALREAEPQGYLAQSLTARIAELKSGYQLN
ncbi:MAG: M48 family metalloprotease [Gammaproteobacteria bacterium]|nr:M48 family metalloprotease [Gammaproteobacteria bacterium]